MTTSTFASAPAFSYRPRLGRALMRALSAHAARWEEHFKTLEDTEPMHQIVPAVRPTIW